MGATSWRYYAPYDPDPEAALQALRAEVFARGEYTDPTGPLDAVLKEKARMFGEDPEGPETRALIEEGKRLDKAIRTGDTRGLGRGERALVERVRGMVRLAEAFGAAAPPPPGEGPPRTIAELLERAAECGTHSILDIERVGRRMGFGTAAPLAKAALRRLFATAEPTRDQVEARWSDIAEGLGRWQARYVVVYREGKPHEYAFIGCSGD